MNNLTSLQRSYLRSLAHHLEPIALIGKDGVTNGAIETVQKVLETRELIKIKFREFKDKKKSLSQQIAKSTESEVVGMIGHTTILFRQNADPEKQNIQLPALK